MCRQRTARMAGIFFLAVASAALADNLTIDWWTLDGGGEMWTTGGGFELSGTIAQPDASLILMTGGGFEVSGGFWPGALGVGPPVPGDCDGNGFVDLSDFGVLAGCMAGPAANMPPGCACVDMDNDGDVDLADFAEFQAAFLPP